MKPCNLEVPADDCRALADILARVGDKWSMFVIALLADGPKRFSELKRAITGVSQKMLTITLRGLERDGFLTRTVTPSIPPRVDYALTRLGRDVLRPVNAFARFALSRRKDVEAARARYDKRSASPLPRSSRTGPP